MSPYFMREVRNYTSAPSGHRKVVMPLSEDPNFGYKKGDEVMFCDLFRATNIQWIYDLKLFYGLFYGTISVYTIGRRKVGD
jgi:hypothetical protein